jgi:hypothetical protein
MKQYMIAAKRAQYAGKNSVFKLAHTYKAKASIRGKPAHEISYFISGTLV